MNGTIEATNNQKWWTVMVLSMIPIALGFLWKEETLLINHRIIMISACVLLIAYSFFHAVYSVTMNQEGIFSSFLGKPHQAIRWEQIDTVAISRDYKINLKVSGNTRIIVIPQGHSINALNKLGAVGYIVKFHRTVIWMDDTKKNREYIKKIWGELLENR